MSVKDKIFDTDKAEKDKQRVESEVTFPQYFVQSILAFFVLSSIIFLLKYYRTFIA